MAFVLYRSNRVEQLARALCEVVSDPLPSPLARELIVVQGPGMERWLSMQLATHLGVWANPWFPFPHALVELALEAALPELPASPLYTPSVLSFVIARLLPKLLPTPAFAEFRGYLADDSQGDRLLALSASLAKAYDQYLIYRPELLLGWQSSSDTQAQAVLWRAIREAAGGAHMAERLRALQGARSRTADAALASALPPRLHVFGISTLPPAFLHVLSRLSGPLDVHFFLLAPTPEYYGDLTRSYGTGHDITSLLENLGKVGRELTDQLTDVDKIEHELFQRPGADCTLHALQSDLLDLTVRGPGAERPHSLCEDDLSLRVHACHSPEREIEVLCDQLRARFEADLTLMPHDVVVFAPDIERYVPAIESALGAAAGAWAIPYRIADRRVSRVSEITDTFLSLLDLCGSRFYLSEVLDLLHRPAVRQRFDMSDSELDLAENWLVEAGARWSIDAQHRELAEQPRCNQNSLRFALDRLRLSAATRSAQVEPFGDVQPASDIEGEQALTLAKLSRYLEELFEVARELSTPRPAHAFLPLLGAALSRLLSAEGELGLGHYALRSALADLVAEATLAEFDAPMTLASIRRTLSERVDQSRESAGFLSGGMTFCEHVPMRAIPFRVVAMIGLDDESFPRRSTRPSFDLMARQPKPGDRSLRDDDRQLFLEALLSARDALIVTYCGRSAKDDSVRPPSVLLDQLLRVVDRHVVFRASDANLTLAFEGETAQRISHVHALSRFDRRYFKNVKHPVYFSYDAEARDVAERWLSDAPSRVTPFLITPLPSDRPLDQTIDLENLLRFFRLPARYFLQKRLGVYLPRDLDPIEDREPLAPDALTRYDVGSDLLDALSDLSPEQRLSRLSREGRIPAGMLGRLWLRDVEETSHAIAHAWPAPAASPPRWLELNLGQRRVIGQVNDLFGSTRITRTFATARTKHLLATWIPHLFLCAAQPEAGFQSVLVSKEKQAAKAHLFAFEGEAQSLLSDLCDLFELGQRSALPFFIDAADAYVEARRKGAEHSEALSKVSTSASYTPVANDLQDPYVRQVFGALTQDDLGALTACQAGADASFAALAMRILEPMHANLARSDR